MWNRCSKVDILVHYGDPVIGAAKKNEAKDKSIYLHLTIMMHLHLSKKKGHFHKKKKDTQLKYFKILKNVSILRKYSNVARVTGIC